MKNLIKKVPIPIAAVALGFAGLGNLLQSYSESIRSLCGIISFVLLLLLTLKIIFFKEDFNNELKNPIMAGVFAAYPMTLMLLSTYIKPLIGQAAFYIWALALLLNVFIILKFTVNFVLKLDIKKVFASYFILYVGIVIASVSAPAFEMQKLGQAIFWYGFIAFILLFVLVTYRHLKYKEIPEPAQPIVCIYAAPLSLCIAGYVQSVANKNPSFLLGMLAIATLIYIFMVIKAFGFIRKNKFFPSFAAFTFPFVISAIASKQTMAFMAKSGNPIPALGVLVNIQTFIAIVFCSYTLVKYIQFLSKK